MLLTALYPLKTVAKDPLPISEPKRYFPTCSRGCFAVDVIVEDGGRESTSEASRRKDWLSRGREGEGEEVGEVARVCFWGGTERDGGGLGERRGSEGASSLRRWRREGGRSFFFSMPPYRVFELQKRFTPISRDREWKRIIFRGG